MEPITYVAMPQEKYRTLIDTIERVRRMLDSIEDRSGYMTTKEVCQLLHTSPATWARHCKKHGIRRVRIGRSLLTRVSDIERMLADELRQLP